MAPVIPTHSSSVLSGQDLLRAAHHGDWDFISNAMEDLRTSAAPGTPAALSELAQSLEQALTAAKAVRADLAASLVRLSAAAKFGQCQDSAAPAKP